MRILGLDPGLRHTGWGVIDSQLSTLRLIDCGCISPGPDLPYAERLAILHTALKEIIERYQPREAAIEETFVNQNPASTLKLGAARGVVMMTPGLYHIPVTEYAANRIKKAVVGVGHAQKEQVGHMVRRLLPGHPIESEDAADALAVAICHGSNIATRDIIIAKRTAFPGA